MMQLTPPRRRRQQRPIITPLDPGDEIAVRKALIEMAFAAWETADSWAQAERLALDTIDSLAAGGLHVLKVDWR
jgi:hypothetical protein